MINISELSLIKNFNTIEIFETAVLISLIENFSLVLFSRFIADYYLEQKKNVKDNFDF